MAQKQVGSASVAITKLIDGTNQYIFIRYSKNENGNPMTETAQADTKYMGIYTSTKNVASTDYRDYSWALIKGEEGQSPVSGVLTDEFIAINTDADGLNGDFSKATTSIMLFEGLTENTKDWNIQVTTSSGVNGTYDSTSATYKVNAMTVDSGTITFTAKKGTATIVKKAKVQKVKPGQDGSDGDDGKGIETTKVTYQKSTSGSSIPSGDWSETIPTLAKGDFIWTRTIITYTDQSTSTSYSVGFIGFDGDDGNPGNDGVGIESTKIEYQSGTSGTVVPTGNWSTTIPSVAQKEYLWTRTTITYTNGSTSTSYSVGRMGEQGPKGDKGDDAQLLYLSSTADIMQFNANNQPTSAQTITITANLQNITGTASFTAIPYINETAQTAVTLGGTGNVRTLTSAQWNVDWTRVVIKATLGSLSDSQTIVKLKESKDGQDGNDGLGIKSTKIEYQASTSGTVAPTGTWSTTVPSVANNQFLWTRTTIIFTDNSDTVAYSVGRMGADGTDGDAGLGISSTVVEYQAANSGVNIPTGTWLTTIPTVNENQYLWTRTTFKYTDNSTKFAYSVGKMGANGQTSYLHRAWAWSSDGKTRFTLIYPSDNLLNTATVTKGKYSTNTGAEFSNAGWFYSDYIDTTYIKKIITTGYTNLGNTPSTCYYDKDKNFVKGINNATVSKAKEIDIDPNISFIRFSGAIADLNTLKLTVADGDFQNIYPTFAGTYTDFSPVNSTDPTKYTWERSLGQSGENAVVGLLTNESITLAATTSGTVSDYSKATGTFKVYNGLNEVTSESTFALKSSAGGTFAINSSGVYSMSAMSTDTAQAVFTATYKRVVIEKTLTVSKSKTGASGENSTSYWLVLSSQVLSVPKGATQLVPRNFSIVPMRQTGTGNAEPFTGRIIIDETTNGIDWTNKYSGDDSTYVYSPTGINVQAVRVQLKLNSGATALLDQKSVNVVRDGVNGAPGQDGSSSHTWVRYSKNADGNPMTTIPNKDTKYIGISITSSNYPPSSYSAYTWARIKGDGGLKTKLYTSTGANINQEPIEIFSETQFDGDIVNPGQIVWYSAKESNDTFTKIENISEIEITDKNSIIIFPNYFLKENSITFKVEIEFESSKAFDQITITNKAFDAMQPLILRQPVAPNNAYPGLLWMDTSSVDNYIYRWGRTPRQEPNGVKYTHFAYTNSVEDWQDFTVYYPYANEIRNGVNINDTSFWAVNRTTIIATDHNYYPNGKTLRVGNTSVNEGFVYANNKAYRPLKAAGSVYTFGMTGFMNSDCKGVDVVILARPVGSTSQYTLVTTIVAAKMFSSSQAEKLVVNWTVPSTWTGNLEYILRFDNNGSKTEGTLATFYMADVYFREGKQDATAPALPAPEDDSANAFMHFVGTYVDKTEADSLDPNKYNWVTLNNASTYEDNSGNKGVEEEDFVTVYDWGWIVLTPEEKEGIPWLNNEDGSTMIDWIYQITQNTSDSSIINKVVGSEQMKDVYASSDDLNELVGSNKELAAKMEEYNLLMQQYADQINSMYTNMTEMQQTIDKFLFNIESAGGVNIIRNSTGFQYDDETGDFYKWIKWLNKGTVTQEMGNQSLNDLGFVAGFRFNGYQASLKQDLDLPAPDIEYTLSTYISILNNTPGASRIVVKIVDRDNESLVYGRISTDGADIPASDRFSVTFNSPSTKVRIEIALWTDNADTSTTASALVAGTMLNIGPFPLSWQAHHEEVYSTNVRMDGSGLKVFNNDYEGYNVMTPREFAGYYKNGDQYEKVFTLNKDTTEVKKLQAEERFMMKPIQIVSIDSPVTPGWAFVPYDNDDTPSWNPNILYNITIPQIDSGKVYWPQPRDTPEGPWVEGNVSKPENTVFRVTSDGTYATYRFGTQNLDNVNLPYRIGNTYTLSVDLRGNIPSGTQLNFCCEYRTTSAGWAALNPRENIPVTGSFQRFSFTKTVPLNTTRFYLGIQIFTSSGANTPIPAGAYFDMRAPKLEIGSIMTL